MLCHNIYRSAFLTVAIAFSGSALAMDESERNSPISNPNQVVLEGGSANISAVMGAIGGSVNDLDFFSFVAQQGDVITLDIDGGITLDSNGVEDDSRSVDTNIALFSDGGQGYQMLARSVMAADKDEGSVDMRDARIDNYKVTKTGTYIVGVSSGSREFVYPGGGQVTPNWGAIDNGDYTLVISIASSASPTLHVTIDIKPGSGESAPMNLNSKGKIPVALLSAPDFNPVDADTRSLKFGATGNENSLSSCADLSQDLNGDGVLDLVCHFDNRKTNFDYESREGILRGKTSDGRPIEGHGVLKIVGKKH